MGALFEKVKSEILPLEGGYVNDVDDYGNETKFGISKETFPNIDIKSLTLDGAYDLYETNFWNFYKLDLINDQTVANKIFFVLINMNPVKGIKCIQKTLIALGHDNIILDGLFGGQTRGEINKVSVPWFLDRLRVELGLHYLSTVDKDKTQLKFFHGWIKRALS